MRSISTIRQKGLILTVVPLLFVSAFVVAVLFMQRDNRQLQEQSLASKGTLEQMRVLSLDMVDLQARLMGELAYNSTLSSNTLGQAPRDAPSALARLNVLVKGDPVEESLARPVSEDVDSLLSVMSAASQSARMGNRSGALSTLRSPSSQAAFEQFENDMTVLGRYLQVQDAAAQLALAQSWERLYWLLVWGISAQIVLTLALSLLFSSGINERLGKLQENALRLAAGKDLRIPMGGSDEISQLDRVFHEMARQLATASQRERAIIENVMDVVCSVDETGRFTRVSPASVKTWGYRPEELVGRSLRSIVSPQDAGRTEDMLARVREGESALDFENRCAHRNGAVVPMTWSVSWSESERRMFCVARDITERKRNEAQILHQAYHDILTDLPNRILFRDRLNRALAQARRNQQTMAVMFLDLDRFKLVNDSLGHEAGDEALKEIAVRLTSCLRRSDTVARVGGDEFTILLASVSHAEDAGKVAQKILDSLDKPWHWNGKQVHVTGSIGISLYPEDAEDPDTLIRNADTAQYRAKVTRPSSYQFYTASMTESAQERLSIETNLRQALDLGELTLAYQPQVDIGSGKIIGMEALLRWHNPELGDVPPDKFIPAAEDLGLIVPIGYWVLHEACRQNKAWQDAGLAPIRIAVNISVRQFQQSDVYAMVNEVLADTGLQPSYLELEITESSAIASNDTCIATLKHLQNMGVTISIDDFGVGYSSLSYLTALPFDKLKIDPSFVKNLGADAHSEAIVTSIISLARSLDRQVVAEGVETAAQLEFLESRSCDARQGFLFSRALAPDKMTQMLRQEQSGIEIQSTSRTAEPVSADR